jgi:hypothetical protein
LGQDTEDRKPVFPKVEKETYIYINMHMDIYISHSFAAQESDFLGEKPC